MTQYDRPGRVLAEVTDIMMEEEFSYLCDLVRELSLLPEEARDLLMVAELGEYASVDDEPDLGLVRKGGGILGADGRPKDTKYFMHIRLDFYARMERYGVFEALSAIGYEGIERVKFIIFEMQRVYETIYQRVRATVRWLDQQTRSGDKDFSDIVLGDHSLIELFDRLAMFHTLRILMYTGHRLGTDVAAGEHWDRAGITFHLCDTGGGLFVNRVAWNKSCVQLNHRVVAVWLGHQAECLGLGPALLHSVRGVQVPRFAAIFFVALMPNQEYRPLYLAWQRMLELRVHSVA